MDHLTIQASLSRILQLMNSTIPLNLGDLSEKEAASFLSSKRALDCIVTLDKCINYLVQVVKAIATKEKLLSEDGLIKF